MLLIDYSNPGTIFIRELPCLVREPWKINITENALIQDHRVDPIACQTPGARQMNKQTPGIGNPYFSPHHETNEQMTTLGSSAVAFL